MAHSVKGFYTWDQEQIRHFVKGFYLGLETCCAQCERILTWKHDLVWHKFKGYYLGDQEQAWPFVKGCHLVPGTALALCKRILPGTRDWFGTVLKDSTWDQELIWHIV